MQIHPSNVNEVAWTSWLPALGYALAASSGDVLEIGIGHFSTPFLHEYCKGASRTLFSVEKDNDWFNAFSHGFYGVSVFREADPRAFHSFASDFSFVRRTPRFGVVFIDNSPGGRARLDPFLAFIDHSDYLVVHDYHRENEEAISPYLEGINHKIFNDYQPPTLLASKNHKIG